MWTWFSNPAALWSALLVVPLLLLYMLRHRPVRRRVPAIVLWTGVAQSQIATSPFQRLRRSLSLLLMLLALTLLVLALAGLRIPGGESRGSPVVIVIDVTAGMGAKDATGTRLETAVSRAETVIDAAGNSAITLLVWDGNLRPLAPADSDPGVARRALARVRTVQHGASSAALARALEGLSASEDRRVVLISDRAPADLPGVLHVQAGYPVMNVGIVSASLSEVSNSQTDLFFGLELYGSDKPLRVPMVLERVDGERSDLIDARDVDLHPGRRASVTFTDVQPGLYAARLRLDDALALDNVAWLRFSELPVQDVVITGTPPTALRRALEAIADGIGSIRLHEQGLEPTETTAYILNDAASAGTQPRLPTVYLAPHAHPPAANFGTVAPITDGATRPATGFLWRGAGTPDIRVPAAHVFEADRRFVPVLEGDAGPVISLLQRDGGLQDLALAFPLDETAIGFTQRHAFVIFWANWFEYVRRTRDPLPRGAVTTRDSPSVSQAAVTGELSLTHNGERLDVEPGRALMLDTTGVYSFTGLESTLPAFGVSVLDPAVSDTGRAGQDGFDEAAMLEWMSGRNVGGIRRDLDLRPWLALLALGLLMFDWFWFRRKFPMQDPGPVAKRP